MVRVEVTARRPLRPELTRSLVRLGLASSIYAVRQRDDDGPPNDPSKPGILLLALDGVDRKLLYQMLRAGELPALEALLGGLHPLQIRGTRLVLLRRRDLVGLGEGLQLADLGRQGLHFGPALGGIKRHCGISRGKR